MPSQYLKFKAGTTTAGTMLVCMHAHTHTHTHTHTLTHACVCPHTHRHAHTCVDAKLSHTWFNQMFRKKAKPHKNPFQRPPMVQWPPTSIPAVCFQQQASQHAFQTKASQGPHPGMSPALTFSSRKKKEPRSSRFLRGKRMNRRGLDPSGPPLAWVSTNLCSPSTSLVRAMQ